VLVIDGDHGPLIEGFTFVNGHRNGAGGGVRLVGGAAPKTLRSNWILNNTADLSGGGIYLSATFCLSSTIINNTIIGNTAGSPAGGGGGIYVNNCPALIQSNIISGNQATANDGGGIYLTGNTPAQVLGNRILNNTANDDGGGVLVRSNDAYLANNVIRDNTAGDGGNGIRVAGYSTPRLYNNTLVANGPTSGAGLYIGSDSIPTVVNNIIADHEAGVHCSSPVTISFSVFSNTTNLEGDCMSFSNIISDPRLIDEVHLAPDSLAIDAGELTALVPSIDFDGQLRPIDGDCDGIAEVDIGADEAVFELYLPIILKNFN
jgi:parallel beta-helix repeat protein